MQTIGQRILEIKVFYYGNERGSAKKFAEAVNESPNVVSNWFSRGDNIGREVINKILAAFPKVDRGWLVGGNGTMFGEPKEVTASKEGVPYYDLDFIGEFDAIFKNPNIHPEYLIDFKPFNNASCWCNVTGHSMEPEINHGDTIALKLVTDLSFIPLGEIYAIVTKSDIRTIKRIGPSEREGYVKLIPTNKSEGYGSQNLEISKIEKLFLVLGCVKRM